MKEGIFHGHKTVIIENEYFRLECLAEAGPRIVRLIPIWMGENLFAEAPDLNFTTSLGEYHYFGGHRLWYAPESPPRTYLPDNTGLSVKQVHGGIRLIGVEDHETGIQKFVTIQMSATHPFIIVKHKLRNHGQASVKLAPWAVTMMRPGGTAILPQAIKTMDVNGVLPNRHFALWPYTRWDDRRLRLGEEFIRVKAGAPREGMKFGYFNPNGWMGYLFDDVFFVKRFGVRSDETYPDYGCNSEVFSNHRMVELQSLGPVVELAPNQEVVHTETWEVYKEAEVSKDMLRGKTLKEILMG